MRRLLAGILMSIGLLVGSLTLSGWWIRHTLLDPSRTERVAEAVLDNSSVRRELARRLVEGVASTLPAEATGPLGAFRTDVEDSLASPAMTEPLRLVVVDVHRRLVGQSTGPVVVSPAVVVTVIRDAAPGLDPTLLASLPEVRFDVPEATPLSTARERLPGVLGLGAGLAVALVAMAFVVHPRRDHLLVRLGWWLLGVSAVQLFFLYVVPVVIAPALVDNVWTGLVSEVALASASGVLGLLAALAVGGVGCLITGRSWRAAIEHPRPARRLPARVVGPGGPAVAPPAAPTTYSPGATRPRPVSGSRDGRGWRL